MENDIIEFLQQSNYIENEFSSQALEDAIKTWKYISKQAKLTTKNILKSHRIMAKQELLYLKKRKEIIERFPFG